MRTKVSVRVFFPVEFVSLFSYFRLPVPFSFFFCAIFFVGLDCNLSVFYLRVCGGRRGRVAGFDASLVHYDNTGGR